MYQGAFKIIGCHFQPINGKNNLPFFYRSTAVMDSNISLSNDKVLSIGSQFYMILLIAVLISVAWSDYS